MKPVAQKWWTLFGVSLGVFMSTLDGGITNIALPALLRVFHSDFPTVQWVALAYLMVIASCTLVAARLGDLRGKKRMFALGIVLFTTGSALCALAPGIRVLALLRAFQATGAVLMGGLGMAIVSTAFPPQERGLALGFIGTTVSVGIALGPTLGGIILGLAGWRWIFLVNLPVGIFAWLVVRRQVPDDPPAAPGERFDIPGMLLMFLALGAYTIGMTMGQRLGFARPLVLLLLSTGAVAMIGFLALERRVRAPMLDLTLFHNLPFALNLCMGFLIFVVMGGMFLLPFFLDLVLHLPPQKAGLLIATVPISMGLVSPGAGALADRFGSRIISLAGLLVTVAACLLISTLHANVSTVGYILRLLPFGVGIGMFQSPNNRAVMHAAPHHRLGVASGLLALSRTLGMVTGMPLLGAIFAVRVGAATHAGPAEISQAAPEAIVTALSWTFRFAAGVLLVSSVLAAAAWRTDRRVAQPSQTRYHPDAGAGKRPGTKETR
jgi:EmrB/QacA subfamily drug resistance transporter